jgi:two-component system, OmpR family, phosphate regulon sensor histidine kinase PhoR
MKNKLLLQNLLGMLLSCLLYIGAFSATFFLTDLIYMKTGYLPNNFFVQLINSSLGLLLVLIILKILQHFDKQTSGVFDSIIRAQRKIAGGDFSVSLDKKQEGLGPFGELVDSINDMATELSKMENMRQEFISNVSHEIQSPLTSIIGFTKVLKNEKLNPEERLHYLNVIEDESVRLSRLSDNLLKLASLDTDTINFEPRAYRLDKQLRKIILSFEPIWTAKNIIMDVSLEDLEVIADEDMMCQVWINLIHNSIKFTQEGGSIQVSLYSQEASIEFKISDTGIGIAQEDQNRIFERFYKADQSRTPSVKGSGLGLSIAKRIIDMHRGTISLQSTLGEGTTFKVTLPRI